MKNTHRSIARVRRSAAAGFSLVEVMVSVGIMTLIMGATMSALSQAMKANETAVLVTAMNNSLRTGMDLMIRDLLQVGSGLPPGHYVLIPFGTATRVKIPGPPGTATTTAPGDTDLNAVNPGTGAGPLVNLVTGGACSTPGTGCVATDTITTLAADSTFTHIPLATRAANGTSITVALRGLDNIAGNADDINIGAGPDRVSAGQLIMLEKGSYAVLLQVTGVVPATGVISFATPDSLQLNQHTAPSGSVAGLNGLNNWLPSPDTAPVAPATTLTTMATRVRMITYYIDATDPAHPKLVRRINNGHPTVFNNNSGSTVAFDIDNLQISYDIADGVINPANVRFTAADLAGTGACAQPAPVGPTPCSFNQVRKVNITLSARSRSVFSSSKKYFRNSLSTQVSLRGMAFVNEYVQ
jgi:type II secretory pathway pseudopilin PulG